MRPTAGRARLLGDVLDQLKTALAFIISDNDEQLPELTLVVGADHGKDLSQVLIRERGWQSGHCFNEVVSLGPIRRATSRIDKQEWPGVVTSNFVRGSSIGLDKEVAKLSENAKPDPCSQSDLVANTDTAKVIRQRNWVLATEKTGKQLTNALRSGD